MSGGGSSNSDSPELSGLCFMSGIPYWTSGAPRQWAADACRTANAKDRQRAVRDAGDATAAMLRIHFDQVADRSPSIAAFEMNLKSP
jgi:hypothetical protein